MSRDGDIEEVAGATEEISPESDVYSYSLLAAPQERKKHGYFTNDAGMSYVLVVLVLIMQGVMLYCVYNKVVVNNVRWIGSIMKSEQDWALFAPPPEGCATAESLCTITNGTYSCAPPSVQLVGRWNELDVNGDGIWTREEVMRHRERLKCKYVVDPVEIFDVFIFFLQEREALLWLHPDVRKGKAIHKPYFVYAMGDLAMCGYRTAEMCPNLLKRGVFHAALKYNTAPRVGNTVESALDYCRGMLTPMGFCERKLPSTYATWKIESSVQCQTPKYKKFTYENPANGKIKSLLEVDYKARQRYETAQTQLFMVYKGIICAVWMLLIISQMRGVFRTLSFVFHFPRVESEAKSARSNSSDDDKVEGITDRHRIIMGIVTFMRLWMLAVLMYVGLSFLGRQTDYIGLLLDGVALIFIIDVQEIVYERVIRAAVRNTWEDSDSVFVSKIGIPGLDRRPDIEDIVWLVLIMVASWLFMQQLTNNIVTPLHDSLECACLGEGQHCHEEDRFSQGFWDQYWRYDVPNVFKAVEKLRHGAKGANLLAPSPGPAAAPSPASLLQRIRLHAH